MARSIKESLLTETHHQMVAHSQIQERVDIRTKNLKTRISHQISQVKICVCLMISSHRQQSQLPFTQAWHSIQTKATCKAIQTSWVKQTASVDSITLPSQLKNGLQAFILSLGCHHLHLEERISINTRPRTNMTIAISLNKRPIKWSLSYLRQKFEPLRSRRSRWRLHHQLKLKFRR